MDKHTPGPWVAMQNGRYVTDNPWSVDHEEGNDNTIAPIGGPNGQVVAIVVMDDENRADRWDDTELDANAALIAAAPDLLADLREAAATLRRYETLHRAKGTAESTAKAEVNAEIASRFEATIAKATSA